MYQAQFQQADEHKGAPLQAYDGGQNANPLKQLLDTLLITWDGNSDEWTLLQYLAWLDHEFISNELLLAITRNDPAVLQKTIIKLEKLGLVKVINKEGLDGLTISREVQDQAVNYAAQNSAASKEPIQLLAGLLELFGSFLPEVTDKSDGGWQKARAYVPIIDALLEHSDRRKLYVPDNKELAVLYSKLAVFYEKISVDAQKSLEYKAKALAIYLDTPRGNHPRDTMLTLLMIEGNSSEEWNLLQPIAWLDSEFIPVELLLALVENGMVENDKVKLWKTIGNLEKLSIVETASKGEARGITIPRDMQEQIVDYMNHNPAVSKDPTTLSQRMLELLENLLPEITASPDENWKRAAVYAPAVEALLEHSARRNLPILESKELALLNAKLGAFYWNVSIDAQKTLNYKARALAIYQALYQGNHPDIANSLNNLGATYAALGCVNKALPYLEQALEMKQSLYAGPRHDVANALNNLGGVYVTLGESWKGIAHFLQALMMSQALYQGTHPIVAGSLNNLGSAYATIGKTLQGLDYQKQALTMYEALYEAPHADIAMTLYNIGTALEKLGDAQQSLIYKERALEMRHDLYEGPHPDVARSLHSVGDAYKILGDAKKALDYYERAFEIRQAIYAEKHPDVASSLNAIGMAHEALGDANRCLDYQMRALQIWQALSQGNHPGIATSLNNLAVAYRRLGDDQKSLDYSEQALNMRQALYQGNHPDVAESLNNVGVAYENLGDIRKGLDYQEQALKMIQALYQGNHPDVATYLNNVGIAYENLGDIRKGLDYKEQALKMIQALYQGNHPDVATYLNNVGFAYENLGDNRKALDYYEQALKMWQALYQGNHPDVAQSLNNVGVAYQKLGDNRKALDYYEQALNMRQALYQGNHPDVAESLNNVGVAYQKLGDVNKARDYFGRADRMKQALKGQEEFKGQGSLGYVSDVSFEYYNSALDQILGLRLRGIDYNGGAVVLKSQYFGEGFNAAGLAYDVGITLAGGDIKTIVAPINLYNKHWLGLLFNVVGTAVEVIYMDSEQVRPVPKLKEELQTGLAVNGYKIGFVEAKLERQRYNNCGSEVIENFVYYLTGTRATQEAAVYVHSLLVENSLLDAQEYAMKLEENTKLVRLLSNAAPLPIRSIGVTFMPSSDSIREPLKAFGYPRVKQEYNNGALGADGQAALNLLPALEQFNRLAAKWVQDKLQQVNAGIYKTTLGFKGLDLAVDSARLVYDPEPDNAKKVALDAAQLYGMYSGVNGYSALVTGAEVVYQLHLGEYQKARDVAAGTVSSMALPVILAYANKPYLGFVYSLFVAASTVHNALENTYSFIKELAGEDRSEE